jgi:DNA end-binding protein Ku
LAKVKLRTRTQLGLLRPHGKIFALEVMRFADEIVDPKEIVVPDVKPATDRELKLALDLVGQLEGPFDPQKHPDEYRAAVEAAVERKVEAQETKRDESEGAEAPSAGGATVIDLAELLSRSLKSTEPKGGPVKARGESAEAAGPKKTKGAAPKKKAASEK